MRYLDNFKPWKSSRSSSSVAPRPPGQGHLRDNRGSSSQDPNQTRLDRRSTGRSENLNIEAHIRREQVNDPIVPPGGRGHGQPPQGSGGAPSYAQAATKQTPAPTQASEASLKRGDPRNQPKQDSRQDPRYDQQQDPRQDLRQDPRHNPRQDSHQGPPQGPPPPSEDTLIDLDESDNPDSYTKYKPVHTSSIDVTYPESVETERDHSSLAKEVETLHDEHERLKQSKLQAEDTEASLRRDIKKRDVKIEKLTKDLDRIRKERDAAEEAEGVVVKQDARIHRLKEEIKTLKADRDAAENEQVADKAYYEKELARKDSYREKYSIARADVTKYKGFAESHEQELKRASDYIATLQSQHRAMETTISELNGDIAKFGNSRPGTKHDDTYFKTAYSRIFDACNQWARVLCRHGNVDHNQLQTLFPQGVTFCQNMAGPNQDWTNLFLQDPAQIVESLLVMIITGEIMNLHLLEAIIPDDVFTYLLHDAVFGEDEESQQMRILCFRRLQKQPLFNQNLGHHLSNSTQWLFNELNKCASISPKPISDEKRQKQCENRMEKLYSILTDAANVYLEQMQEPALFTFEGITPAGPFKSEAMTAVEDPNVDLTNPVVYIGATPVVLKRMYDVQTPMVLCKAKVYLQPMEQMAQQWVSSMPEDELRKQDPVTRDMGNDGAAFQVDEVDLYGEETMNDAKIESKGAGHEVDEDNEMSTCTAMGF